MFAIFPDYNSSPGYFPKGDLYMHEDVHAILNGLFTKHGFYVVDLKDFMKGHEFREIAIDGSHPSLAGHRLVAEVLRDRIIGDVSKRDTHP